MGIFTQEFIESAINDQFPSSSGIRKYANGEGPVGYWGEMAAIDHEIDLLMEKFDEYDEEDFINEAFVDDFKEDLHYLMTLINEGREAMLEESYKAAKEVKDYHDEINNLINSNATILEKLFYVREVYLEIRDYGFVTVYTYYYRSPKFSGLIFKIDDVVKAVNDGTIKKLKKKTIKTVWQITKYAPQINYTMVKKKNAKEAVKMLADSLTASQKTITLYKKLSEGMKQAVDQWKAAAAKEESKELHKWISKFAKYQVRVYRHDTGLMHATNIMIVRQAREVDQVIRKASKV